MAIQEFIIGPQNYFEAGYFDGDYTLPNVSKAFLECDVDKIRGGRVVTGEYFLDNYIDGTYYHDNSIRSALVCNAMIVQEATVGLQGYYSEGYFGPGYYQTRGSFFVLTAELTAFGEDVFATGSFASSASITITASKTTSAQITLVSQFTQVAQGARERDIDLFAFSNAALAAAVQASRNYSIDAFAAFNIATDGRRYRDISAAEQALFTFDVANSRSRNFNIETQAAFSLSAGANVIKGTTANISAVASIVAQPFNPVEFASNISATTAVSTSKYAGYLRPGVTTTVGTLTYDTVPKYGTYSAKGGYAYKALPSNRNNPDWAIATNEQFAIEFHVRRTSGTNSDVSSGGSPHIFLSSRTTTSTWADLTSTSTTSWSIGLFYNSSGLNSGRWQWRFRFNGTTGIVNLNSDTLSDFNSLTGLFNIDTWYHIAVTRGSDGVIRLYQDGSQIGSVAYSGFIAQNGANRLSINANAVFGTGGATGYIDEFSYKVGSSAITTASQQGTNENLVPYQQLLLHLENNLNDDLLLNASASANLAAASSVAITANGNSKQTGANLQVTGFQLFLGGKLKTATVALTAQFNQSTNAGRPVESSASLNSQFTQTVTNPQIVQVTTVVMNATASMTVTARKTARITRTLSAISSLSLTAFVAEADPGPSNVLKPYSLYHFDSFTPIYALPPNENIIQSHRTYDEYNATRFVTAEPFSTLTKFGAGALGSPSGSFGGNVGSNLTSPVSGSGDFTVDLWYYWVDPTGTPAGIGRIIGIPNAANTDNLYEIKTYAMAGGAFIIEGTTVFNFSIGGWEHIAIQRNGTELSLWRGGVKLYAQAVAQTAIGNAWSIDMVKASIDNSWYSSRGHIDELRIRNIAGYSNTFTPPTSEYSLEYDYYNEKNGYALLEPTVTLSVQPISVVFIQSSIVLATASLSTTIGKIKVFTANPSSQATLSANAGKQVTVSAVISAAFGQTATARRSRSTVVALTAQADLVIPGRRIRFQAAAVSSEFAQTTTAVKRTGVLASISGQFAQVTNGTRIRFASSEFQAIASELTAAFKNATGTVLLESVASLSATAQKITDRPQLLDSVVTVVAQAQRLRDINVTVSATATVTADYDKIRPAGSEMQSQFTINVDTTNSKITRVTAQASSNFTETVTTLNSRKRFATANLNAVSAVICNNQVLKLAAAALGSQFQSIFIITKVVRITANLQTQGFQITVGDVLNIDPFNQLRVAQETRQGTVLPENRVIAVNEETRVNIIQGYTL